MAQLKKQENLRPESLQESIRSIRRPQGAVLGICSQIGSAFGGPVLSTIRALNWVTLAIFFSSAPWLVVWAEENSLPKYQADPLEDPCQDGGPLPWDDCQVNTFTTGNQFEPDLVVGSDGDYAIIWTSFDTVESGSTVESHRVMTRRFFSDGTSQDEDFQVNTYTTNSQGVATAVTVDQEQRFLAVWRSFGSTGTDNDSGSIQARLLGGDEAPEQQVNLSTSGWQTHASVVPVPGTDGGFLVVWRHPTPDEGVGTDKEAIQGRFLDSEGNPIGDELDLAHEISLIGTLPSVQPEVVMQPDGGFVMVWDETVVGRGWDVLGRRFTSEGTAIGADLDILSSTYASGNQEDPEIAIAADGGFVVVWRTEEGASAGNDDNRSSIQGRIFNQDGSARTPQFQVNTHTPLEQSLPAVAVGPDGDFVVAWRSFGSSGSDADETSIQARRFASDGSALGNDFQVNTFTSDYQSVPQIAFKPDGNYVVVWQSTRSPGSDTDKAIIKRLLPLSDLAVMVADPTATATPGEDLSYEIEVANLGPSYGKDIELIFEPAPGLSCSWKDSLGLGIHGDTAKREETTLSRVFAMEAGGQEDISTFDVDCSIDSSASGILSSTVRAASAANDPDLDNNHHTFETTLEPKADLAVSFTESPDTAIPGETVARYIIKATNYNGPSDVQSAHLEGVFPIGELTECQWSSSAEGGATGHSPSGSGNLMETLSMPAGSSVTYDISCDVVSSATGTVSNTVTLSSTAAELNNTNNSALAEMVLTPVADVEVQKTSSIRSAVQGQSFEYTIEVSNHGPSAAHSAVVQDVFPDALTCDWICAPSSEDVGCSHTGSHYGMDLEDIVYLPVAEKATYTASCTVQESFEQTLRNTATATLSNDPNLGNNVAFADVGPPLRLPLVETFDETAEGRWHLEGSAALDGGWLVLTENELDQKGAAILDAPFRSDLGLVIEFEYFIGGGSGGNGLALFLVDGTSEASVGAPGACLGYADGPMCGPDPGIENGYLGIGFDVAGEFSSSGVGDSGPDLGVPNTVTLRGAEGDDYPFLTRALTRDDIAGSRRVVVWLTRSRVTVALESETGVQPVIHQFDFESGPSPESFRLGFSGSTGLSSEAGDTNVHKVRNLRITAPEIADGLDRWLPAVSMASSRGEHTLTLLQDGRVLAVGSRNSIATELYDPRDGTWKPSGSLNAPTTKHTATLLPSGKVLIAGQEGCEIYDPVTESWSPTGGFQSFRTLHTATLLPSGRVLAVGGMDNVGEALSSVELYDPDVGTWSEMPALRRPRAFHTSTLLPSGEVLIAGGSGAATTAEIYDPESLGTNTGELFHDLRSPAGFQRHTATLLPALGPGPEDTSRILLAGGGALEACLLDPATGDCEPTETMAQARYASVATLLPSGRVLITGGLDLPQEELANTLASVEIYDPKNNRWQSSNLEIARWSHAAVLLPSGNVLTTGGFREPLSGSLSIAQIFQPYRGHWKTTGPLSAPRFGGHTTSWLPSGKILLVGGEDHSGGFRTAVETYDPATGSWSSEVSLSAGRAWHTATLLPGTGAESGGRVLLVGGREGSGSSHVEIYEPEGVWITGAPTGNRSRHSATLLPDGRVWIAGGSNGSTLVEKTEIYDPSLDVWAEAGDLPEPRIRHTATLLHSGQVLVVGGRGAEGIGLGSLLYTAGSDSLGIWSAIDSPGDARSDHSATLLPSGKVLIAGGMGTSGVPLTTTEIYDPESESWSQTAPMDRGRSRHTAMLLVSGKVLVIGGEIDSRRPQTAEIFDPATESWSPAGALPYLRLFDPAAALLSSGEVLVAGLSAEIYDANGFSSLRRRPEITSVSGPVGYFGRQTVLGTGFRGDSEASGGGPAFASSAVDYPLVQLRGMENGGQSWWVPNPAGSFSETSLVLGDGHLDSQGPVDELSPFFDLPPIFNPGWHVLTVFTSGVTSESKAVYFECDLEIMKPPQEPPVAAVGSTVTFTVETQGGRTFQWQKGGFDIPGATESSYTTPPVLGGDSGSSYRVRVGNGCITKTSASASLFVEDLEDPVVSVESPKGGEYWLLSESGQEPNSELVTWEMSDTRICQVRVSLLVSHDGGETFLELNDPMLDLPKTFGPGGRCPAPGESTTNTEFRLPTDFESLGGAGNLYKARVEVTDHAGNASIAESPSPFFIVQPNDDSVKTLILWHRTRMESAFSDLGDLQTKLVELADHPLVQGRVIDLAEVTELSYLYDAWDAEPSDASKANSILFNEDGIQAYVQDLLDSTFTGVEYLVLVGDDRMIPFARLEDRAEILSEEDYTETGLDLTPAGSTVGLALSADLYLSDDPLAVLDAVELESEGGAVRIPASGICRNDVRPHLAYIPDLAVGRLVEEPSEIITTIAGFISQGGLLDLSTRQPHEPQVLVTGYDFLSDSANRITQRWDGVVGEPAIGADLQGPGWTETDLLASLCNSGSPYPIGSLNGHANHYAEGVPGEDPLDIRGLDAGAMIAEDACGPGTRLDLTGGLIYAVGCHGGLSVAAVDPDPDDHAQDLPQTFMGLGTTAYVANTGFGWGLLQGPPGYGERMVVLMTEELTSGGGASVSVGKAVQRVKQRYFLEDSGCFDPYDQKSLMQWTLFGLPMYGVRIGDVDAVDEPGETLRTGIEDLPTEQHFGPVKVNRSVPISNEKATPLPPFLTRVEHSFDFSAEGIYVKRDTAGNVLSDVSGCPDEDGCYYELNGLATGQADLPVEPYFVYESRLLGTSQHGVLWKGGAFLEEDGWRVLRAVLQSNNTDEFSQLGPIGRDLLGCPIGTATLPGADPDEGCPATDIELNKLVVPTGEALVGDDDELSRHRLMLNVDLEVFYFNDTQDPTNNCERSGPVLGDGPFEGAYHRVEGALVTWRVQPTDPEGVWRVLVVFNDGILDAEGRGSWQPLELEHDGNGTWSVAYDAGPGALLNYTIQAVDRRGNVSWLPFVPDPEDPEASSGIPTAMPEVVELETAEAEADLEISLVGSADPVLAGDLLIYTVTVYNHGPSAAEDVTVTDLLSDGVSLVLTSGCTEDPAGVPTCTLDRIESQESAGFDLAVRVRSDLPGGSLTHLATVVSSTLDPGSFANSVELSTEVRVAADLGLAINGFPDPVIAGEALTYTLSITNAGPSDAQEVEVRADLAPELSFVSSGICSEEDPGQVVCVLGTIAGGFSDQIDFEVLVDSAATGPIVQEMRVSSVTTEHQAGNETATESTAVETMADLSITKSDSMDPVTTETFTYTLEVSNPGPSDAKDIMLTDVLPAGLKFESSDECTEASGTVTCDVGILAAGATSSPEITVRLEPSFPPWVDNTASVASATDDPNAVDNSDTERTVLDITSPQVLSIQLDDGIESADCDTVKSEVREISIRFSEDLYDPAGDDDPDDVTHPANYLLVAAGANRSLETDQCGGPLGDDVAIVVDGVSYDSDSWTATVSLNGDEPLPDDIYRLLVCGSTSIVDLVQNPLDGDGDGTGGDDFQRFFRVETADHGNLLRNGHFDCGLGGWTLESTNPEEIVFQSDDFEDSVDSGSVHLTDLTGSSEFEISQCFEIFSRAELEMTGRVRFELMPGPQPPMSFIWRCELFSAPGCDPDSYLESHEHTVTLSDSEGQWLPQEAVLSAPLDARSAHCNFGFSGSADFVAGLDALFVGGDPGLFADGFESGDVSGWSSSSP